MENQVNSEDKQQFIDNVQKYNFSCGSCKKKFLYNNKDILRCPHCGYRILFKERTLNYIEYSTN